MIMVEIMGVNVASIDRSRLLDLVADWIAQSQRRTIFYVNANCLNIACNNKQYRTILNQADLVYPDGISVVWGGWLIKRERLYKVTGADWIDSFCARAEKESWDIYVLAGKPGIAQQAIARLQLRYPELKIAGSDGYFQEKNEEQVLEELNRRQSKVLFVGLGAPVQENWIVKHRQKISSPVCWAVGALFDYVAGVERRSPTWMNKAGLEWMWRLWMDPAGKWKRYLLGNPAFIVRILREYWQNR